MTPYSRDGLIFACPADWSADTEQAANGWTLTLQSPGTAFAVVQMDRSLPEPGDMLEATLAALRAEYRDLEITPTMETIAGDVALGHEIEFLSFDVPVLCWTRSFFGPAGTVLVMCQVSDVDRAEHEPALRGLTASMRLDD